MPPTVQRHQIEVAEAAVCSCGERSSRSEFRHEKIAWAHRHLLEMLLASGKREGVEGAPGYG